jgi:cell division protein FtsI/penicillin-binding protein 2
VDSGHTCLPVIYMTLGLSRRQFLLGALLLPIKTDLQDAVRKAMADRRGVAIVVDVLSGRLVAASRDGVADRRAAPPGSVMKPFALSSMLETGILRDSTRWKCQRTLRINGRRLDCLHPEMGEPFGPVEALAYSCNSFFAHFASRLDPAVFVAALKTFGFAPTVPRDSGSLQLLALGESNILATPLQIASAYRRLANTNATLILAALTAATDYGTARLARPSGIIVAGKTGTATSQVGARAHAWFAGFAPVSRPQVVVVVFLETGSGGGDAAPIAKQIFAAS